MDLFFGVPVHCSQCGEGEYRENRDRLVCPEPHQIPRHADAAQDIKTKEDLTKGVETSSRWLGRHRFSLISIAIWETREARANLKMVVLFLPEGGSFDSS